MQKRVFVATTGRASTRTDAGDEGEEKQIDDNLPTCWHIDSEDNSDVTGGVGRLDDDRTDVEVRVELFEVGELRFDGEPDEPRLKSEV